MRKLPLLEANEGWDKIVVTDLDTGLANTKGRITASIWRYLDVALTSLNMRYPNEERHILAP